MFEKNVQKAPLDNEPLFVLRYRTYSLIVRLALFFVFTPIFFMAIGLPASNLKILFSKIVLLLLGLWCTYLLIDFLLFKEIRLYRDRIVKINNIIGIREVNLHDAKLTGNNIVFGIKVFHKNGTDWFFGGQIKGVFYDDSAARYEDAEKLNSLLAQLSGRKIDDFKKMNIKLKKFIKEEKDE